MKNLDTLIQNAIEDYVVSLDKEPTLEDVKEICTFDISSVIWTRRHCLINSRRSEITAFVCRCVDIDDI